MTGAYTASFLPIVFVPLICMVLFAVVLGFLFVYIESEA